MRTIFAALNVCQVFCSSSWASTEVNKFNLYGVVFYDQNQNGIRESNELGIAGVELILEGSEQTLTKKDGRYKIEISTDKEFVSLQVEQTSLPPGSFFTTGSNQHFNLKTGQVRRQDFGIFYPKGKSSFYLHSKDEGNFLKIDKKHRILYSMDHDNFFINKKPIAVLSKRSFEKSKQPSRKYFNISFDPDTLKQGQVELIKETLSNTKLPVNEITIDIYFQETRQGKTFERKKDFLKKQISFLLKKYSSRQKFRFFKGSNNIKVVTKHNTPYECEVSDSSGKFTVTSKNSYETHYDTQQVFGIEISCGKQTYRLVTPTFEIKEHKGKVIPLSKIIQSKKDRLEFTALFPSSFTASINHESIERRIPHSIHLTPLYTTVLKNEEGVPFSFDVKIIEGEFLKGKALYNKTGVDLYYSDYLEESQTLNVFFNIDQSNIKKFSLNGEEISLRRKNPTQFLFQGERGDNELKLNMTTDNGREFEREFNFTLFREPRLFFHIHRGFTNYTSKSDFLQTQYELNDIQYWNLELGSYFKNSWGLKASYQFDVAKTELFKIRGGSEASRHREIKVQALKSFYLIKDSHLSPKITVSLGIQRKVLEVDDTDDLVFLIPQNHTGLIAGAELYLSELLFSSIDSSSQGHIGRSFSKSGDYALELSQSFFIPLNILGKLSKITPDYIYSYKYPFLKNLYLGLTVGHQWDRRTIENSSKGHLRTTNLYTQLGINFRY